MRSHTDITFITVYYHNYSTLLASVVTLLLFLNTIIRVNCFSCCRGKIPGQNSLKKALTSESCHPSQWGRHGSGSLRQTVMLYLPPGSREKWILMFSWLFVFVLSPRHQPRGLCHPYLGWDMPCQLTQCKNSLPDIPRSDLPTRWSCIMSKFKSLTVIECKEKHIVSTVQGSVYPKCRYLLASCKTSSVDNEKLLFDTKV